MVIYKLLVSEYLVRDVQSPIKNVSIICAVYGRHMVPNLLEMVIILVHTLGKAGGGYLPGPSTPRGLRHSCHWHLPVTLSCGKKKITTCLLLYEQMMS